MPSRLGAPRARKFVSPLLAVVLAAPSLAACTGYPTLTAGPINTATEIFEPISYSCRDTPKTRTAVLEHNSVYDTELARQNARAKGGKFSTVVYRDSCPQAPKPQPPAAPVAAATPPPAAS